MFPQSVRYCNNTLGQVTHLVSHPIGLHFVISSVDHTVLLQVSIYAVIKNDRIVTDYVI